MPTITLPHIRIEAIPETIRRLLSEFRGHVDAGDIEKAKALVPKIKMYVMGTSMAWDFGILAAKAFLSIGMTKDAFEVLEDARKQHIWGHHRTRFSRNVARELLKAGKATLARKDPETAYTIFIKLFRWLEKPELQKSTSTIIEVFGRELFLKEMYRDAVASLTSVVDYYLIRAEDAYKSKDSKAPILLAKAKAMLDRLKKDLKDVPGLKVVVAEPKLTKPGSKTAEYVDIYDPKRVKMKVKQYPGADFPNYFSDRIRRIETILKSKAAQISSVKGFYESDKAVVTLYEKRYGKRPDIHKLTDRRKFWSLKYDFLVGEGKTRQEALQALMDSIGGYLKGFTIHSKYDIPDARADVLTAKFPKATTRQAIMDCGVFAIRTAYELSLIRKKTSMDFYYVFMPIHVGLGIIDKGKTFGWALHNNQISLIKKDINKEGVAQAVGFYFGYAPAPAEASKLKGLSGKALRRALISKFGGLFVPPNLAKLRGTAKKEAIAKGKELKNRYNSLKEQHMRLVRESTYHLINLRDRHKEMGKIKPGEYKKFAVKLIEL